jgi:hypothetical protein
VGDTKDIGRFFWKEERSSTAAPELAIAKE